MPVAINGTSGVITGVATGGLPDGIVDTDMLAADAVTDAKQNLSGVAKVWIKFTGTGTISIDDSFNVSSIADRGTGQYTVNFTNAMSNTNYAAVFGANGSITGYAGPETQNTGSIDTFGSVSGSFYDSVFQNMAVFGDQ